VSQQSTALTADEKSSSRLGGRRLIGVSELQEQIPLSRVWLWKLVKKGLFPRPIKLPGGSINLWFQDEVDQYLKKLAKARDEESNNETAAHHGGRSHF
jgi:predicted DNA-binding transcriptional regulator AlpA